MGGGAFLLVTGAQDCGQALQVLGEDKDTLPTGRGLLTTFGTTTLTRPTSQVVLSAIMHGMRSSAGRRLIFLLHCLARQGPPVSMVTCAQRQACVSSHLWVPPC